MMIIIIINVVKKEAEKILKYKDLIIEIQHVECESKSDLGNNSVEWNHFIVTQTIPEQHTGKARNEGTTTNSHIGHCTHTVEKYKAYFKGEISLQVAHIVSTDQVQHYIP